MARERSRARQRSPCVACPPPALAPLLRADAPGTPCAPAASGQPASAGLSLRAWSWLAFAGSALLHGAALLAALVWIVLPQGRAAEPEGIGTQRAALLVAPPSEAREEEQERRAAEPPPDLPPLLQPVELETFTPPEAAAVEPLPEPPEVPESEDLLRPVPEPPLTPRIVPSPRRAPRAPPEALAPAPAPAPAPSSALAVPTRRGSSLVALRAPRPTLPAGYRVGPEGLVLWLQLYVDTSGRLLSVRVEASTGDPALDEAWRSLVASQWLFAPTDAARWVRMPVTYGRRPP